MFETLQKKRAEVLKQKLLKMVGANEIVETSAVITIINSCFEENERISMEDHVAKEMLLVLEAYGKVASKRIIDDVPSIIMKITQEPFVAHLLAAVNFSDGDLIRFMREDSEYEAKHRALTQKSNKLQAAVDAFKRLQMGATVV
jgi:hypothetical protein